MSGLSTHVLDLVSGQPAAGVAVAVYRDGMFEGDARTDSDGRCKDLQGQGALKVGKYRLVFSIGEYFRVRGLVGADPFFDEVGIDFTIAEAGGRFHVPLLASPFGYSTYRGS